MGKTEYCQCDMERKIGDSVYSLVSYIPVKFARVGSVLKLRDDHGDWTDGWRVLRAGPPGPEPQAPHVTFRKHMEKTGDSLRRGR